MDFDIFDESTIDSEEEEEKDAAKTDPKSICDFFEHAESKKRAIDDLHKEISMLDSLTHAELIKLCAGALDSPKSCRKAMRQQFKHLKVRFTRADSTFDNAGTSFFRDDIDQLELDKMQVLKAGVGGTHNVAFKRLIRKKKK